MLLTLLKGHLVSYGIGLISHMTFGGIMGKECRRRVPGASGWVL